VARIRGLSKGVQGFLNALATGVLVFLLWDILSHAGAPVTEAIDAARSGSSGPFVALVIIFGGGIAIGLLGLVYFNGLLIGHVKEGPGAPSPHMLSLAIATGLGLHNFSEGLAIGESAHVGAIAFAGVLVVGFSLHNITEGFGIAAPMALDSKRPSWGFLGIAGLIGGGPTFIGTWVGYVASSQYVYVLFLAHAAGALLYVLNELFNVGRRISTPRPFAWGLLIGFLVAYATDVFLTLAGG